ncbi:hypothetical protein D3C85_1524490 [compost metagenome]
MINASSETLFQMHHVIVDLSVYMLLNKVEAGNVNQHGAVLCSLTTKLSNCACKDECLYCLDK